jgi:hypothetical protein
LINSLSIPSVYADFFAAVPSEPYRHANEPTFLLLIIGGEGILVHDDNRQLNEDEGKKNGQSPEKIELTTRP